MDSETKTNRENEISGNQQRSSEIFFEKSRANNILLSTDQGLCKRLEATFDWLPSVCREAVKEEKINLSSWDDSHLNSEIHLIPNVFWQIRFAGQGATSLLSEKQDSDQWPKT